MTWVEGQGAKARMTKRRFKDGGLGEVVHYSLTEMELGIMLVARTKDGVCALTMDDDGAHLLDLLRKDLPKAEFIESNAKLGRDVEIILNHMRHGTLMEGLVLDIQATDFEVRVWQGLLNIPWGGSEVYGRLAHHIGAPKAARAVGRACGANPVSIVIPCHRMHAHDGKLVKYAWGLERKAALRDIEGIS